VVGGYAFDGPARVVRYRRRELVPGGVGLAHGWIVADAIEPVEAARRAGADAFAGGRILPLEELAIPGEHNVSNALAAVAVALLFGIAPEAMRQAARAFAGVEHRLERVAELEGVRFVNDSQGTQPDAVIAALRAFDAPIVLIAGGRDKGVDLTELASVVAERAHAAVLIGESAPLLERLFRAAGLETTVRSSTLDAAVAAAEQLAREAAADAAARMAGAGSAATPVTATVLLSPAATSFDMFEDYAARGRAFKAAVHRLVEGRS
jgi:UDP-N-acetylmuramoylalanine--D-glutamate ligase